MGGRCVPVCIHLTSFLLCTFSKPVHAQIKFHGTTRSHLFYFFSTSPVVTQPTATPTCCQWVLQLATKIFFFFPSSFWVVKNHKSYTGEPNLFIFYAPTFGCDIPVVGTLAHTPPALHSLTSAVSPPSRNVANHACTCICGPGLIPFSYHTPPV